MRWIYVAMISLCCWEADALLKELLLPLRKMLDDWLNPRFAWFGIPLPISKIFDQPDTPEKPPEGPPPGVRKECRTLTDAERSLLFQGFQYLFVTKDKSTLNVFTFYEVFMSQHNSMQAPSAHFGPCFPGWHREFLLRLEKELKKFNKAINLCYWDTTLDRWLPDASQSALWTPEFFGNGQGYVTTGFAANRAAQPGLSPACAQDWPNLYRQVGGNSYLYDDNKINNALNGSYTFPNLMQPYTTNTFEANHGGVHVFVGGHMSFISCAVLDPVFWFHHTFIDFLWERFRDIQPTNKETDYPNDADVPANHHATDSMKPFKKYKCIDGLSNKYIPGIYTYVPSPRDCTNHTDCGGKALWCNSGRCTARVGPGGEMVPTWPNAACLITGCANSQNVNSVCTCVP